MEELLIAGRYRVQAQIGSGGEARVFRAHDLREGKDVAVRLPITKPREARAKADVIQHPNWARLLDSGMDTDHGAYQVFELLAGQTLRQKVELAPLPDDAWLIFIRESLGAVKALHTAGWVHGDLNADNFMWDENSAKWKLLELPFLQFAPPDERSAAFGNIHTLAPEQLEGKTADARSDLYALGCLYYFAAAGEFPNAGTTRQEVAISLLRFSPTPLREKCPRLPGETADWVMTLLSRDPQQRPFLDWLSIA